MIYHDEYIVESFSTTTKQSYYTLLSDFQMEAKRSVGYHELTTLCVCTLGIKELLKYQWFMQRSCMRNA